MADGAATVAASRALCGVTMGLVGVG